MKALEILFNRRWVLKSEDKDLYYQIRDAVGEVRKYTTEKLGCQIIDNSMLVKMEKIPVIPETFMGIQSFTSKEEYVYLCILLMFLEDKDAQEQFVLSQLTEYMTAVMPGEITDWTVYTNRRRLIRVLRYVVGQGVVANTWPEHVMKRWNSYIHCPNVTGYVARTDRYGNTSIVTLLMLSNCTP